MASVFVTTIGVSTSPTGIAVALVSFLIWRNKRSRWTNKIFSHCVRTTVPSIFSHNFSAYLINFPHFFSIHSLPPCLVCWIPLCRPAGLPYWSFSASEVVTRAHHYQFSWAICSKLDTWWEKYCEIAQIAWVRGAWATRALQQFWYLSFWVWATSAQPR